MNRGKLEKMLLEGEGGAERLTPSLIVPMKHKKYYLNQSEITFIEEKIKPME